MALDTTPTVSALSHPETKTGKNDDNIIFGANQSELERLDIQHKVVFDCMPQMIYAPLDLSKSGLRILDQATGSGIWLRDARSLATGDHTWVGTDIEDDYFPKNPPADMSYYHQSMTEPWPENEAKSYDLVHSRMAFVGVGSHPLQSTVKGLVDLVKPGGYIQLVEMDWDEWNAGPAGEEFMTACRDLFTMVTGGQAIDMLPKLIPMLKELGLEDIQYKKFPINFGALASEKVRDLSEKSLFSTVTGISMTSKMLPPGTLSPEQLDTLPEKLDKENKERGFMMNFFCLWGRKPAN